MKWSTPMRLSPRSQISGASRRRLALARWLAHQRHRARSGPGSACENRRQPHRFRACLGSMVSARPHGAGSVVENGRTEDLRPLAESEHRGAGIQRPRCPCSAGCRTSLCRSAIQLAEGRPLAEQLGIDPDKAPNRDRTSRSREVAAGGAL